MRFCVIGSNPGKGNVDEQIRFDSFCISLGKYLAEKDVTLNLCSPFQDSADYQFLEGIKNANVRRVRIKVFYPSKEIIKDRWNEVSKSLGNVLVEQFPQEAPISEDSRDWKYSWLFSQIQAVNNSDFVLIIGGNISGASNLLARIADVQEAIIIPFPQFQGVGELFFAKKYFQLIDLWGRQMVEALIENKSAEDIIGRLLEPPKLVEPVTSKINAKSNQSFFISYARKRNAEADFIETILRRRNFIVLRDENAFVPGSDVPNAIMENISKSDVFIALWCQEYACSPWCFDELNTAIESNKRNGKPIWILALDRTRMIHPEARKMLMYDAFSRDSLEAKVLSLLTR